MMRLRPWILALLLTLLAFTGAAADNAPDGFRFEQVFNTGAYNMGITQDREGFLWLTTTGGLIRFDGYQQLIFTEGPKGLTSNFVTCVFEDSEGLLWIATLSGLDLYSKTDGSIKHFQPVPGQTGSIGSNRFNWAPKLITEDQNGGIWIASRDGVFRYDKKDQTFTAVSFLPDDPSLSRSNDVWTIMADRDNNIWIGTTAGLDVYDPRKGARAHYRHHQGADDSLGKGNVYAIFQDREGDIWVGTSEGGLNRFQKESGTFVAYTHNPADPQGIAHNEVFSITQDSKGYLWLGRSFSSSVGLERFDKVTGKFTLYTHNSKEPGTLSGNVVLTCYEDRSGILWVPENTGVVNKHDPYSHQFTLYTPDPGAPETKGLSGLSSVYEDSRGDIWVGGQKGLSRLNHITRRWQSYPIDPGNPQALWNGYTFSVIEDSQGEFWVASDDGYLNLFDRDQGIVIKRYLNPFVQNTAREIIEDHAHPNIFWFGVEGYGLFKFDKSTGNFSQYKSDPDNPEALGNDYVYALLQDKQNIIWVQTQGGLHRFDPATAKFIRYRHDPADPKSISGNVVNDIFIDSKGCYWVSTDQGLNGFDPKTGTFTAYGQANGFSTLIIRAIVEDNAGDLWLGSNNGLFVFDPVKKTVVGHYTVSDGLQGDSFSLYGCSAIKARDGRLWFVGLNGANSFYPEEIRHNSIAPEVYLLNLSQAGEDLVPHLSLSKIKGISLSWRYNYFEFEYVGLNYSQPQKNQYKYKLEGWDNDWYFAGNKRFGRYSGLSGGDYVLKVMATNNDGVWSIAPAEFTIHVQTPFWETWWFSTLLVLLFGGMFSVFYFVRINQLKEFNRELEGAYHDVGIAEKKYRSIFENAVEGIFQLAPNGRLINANPAAATIMGYENPAEMLHDIDHIWDRLQVSRKDRVELITHLQTNGSVSGHEIRVRRKNGETIWLAVNMRVIGDERGGMQYIDGIMEDISTKKEVEEQLRLYREHLEQLVYERTKKYQEINENLQKEIVRREMIEEELLRSKKLESIGVLAGGIAHDFNNLMTVVMGNINLAQMKPGMVASEELDNAVQALRRAKDLTQKFITFSSGGNPIKKILDIEAVTRSAVDLALSGSNIQAVFSVAPGLRKVNADPGHISQAMYNIIDNSKQAMVQGGKIEITIANLDKGREADELPLGAGEYVAIDFQDNGSGIPAEILPKIFDPYFTTAAKGTQKGKGLGLTIAYSIVKKHGGSIFVDSTLGQGTRVRLVLPAVSTKETDDRPAPVAPTPSDKKRILLMDDEELLRDMAGMMLPAIGYEVALAPDGDSAVRMQKEALEAGRPFFAAILDLTIPGGIGGKEVVKILQQQDPHLKAIVSSGYADDPVVAEYQSYGFIGSLSKPYDMKELKEMLLKVSMQPTP